MLLAGFGGRRGSAESACAPVGKFDTLEETWACSSPKKYSNWSLCLRCESHLCLVSFIKKAESLLYILDHMCAPIQRKAAADVHLDSPLTLDGDVGIPVFRGAPCEHGSWMLATMELAWIVNVVACFSLHRLSYRRIPLVTTGLWQTFLELNSVRALADSTPKT